MSRNICHAPIGDPWKELIGALADMIGEKARLPRYTILAFEEMALSGILHCASMESISNRSESNTGMIFSMEVN